jgi:beta-lactamase class D
MKFIFTLLFSIFYISFFLSQERFFILKELGGKWIFQDKNMGKMKSPNSTFKIAISLMAYNENILENESFPLIDYDPYYHLAELDSHKKAQNPASWIKNSCVWYSQVITKKMGIKKFEDYLKKFDYGNQNISGDKNKDGLTNA